jgi:hypothetical protein
MTGARPRRPAATPPADSVTPHRTLEEQIAALTERLESTRGEQVRLSTDAAAAALPRDALLEKIAKLETLVAAQAQATHDIRGNQQTRLAAEVMASKVPIAQRLSPIQAVASALIALVTIGGFITAGVTTYATRQVDSSAMTAKMAIQEGQTRLRDQETQGVKDRLRGLEQSDQTGIEKLQVLQQAIAGILPRLEEILRRQERLESRLGSARPGGLDDSPTVWRQTLPGRT